MGPAIKRFCLDCNHPLQGRMDKKFCDDYCRSSYNNKIRAETNGIIRNFNRVLKRNRDILEQLHANSKDQVSMVQLARLGFNFDYHTHHRFNKEQELHTFCYEFGYRKIEPDKFMLTRDDET